MVNILLTLTQEPKDLHSGSQIVSLWSTSESQPNLCFVKLIRWGSVHQVLDSLLLEEGRALLPNHHYSHRSLSSYICIRCENVWEPYHTTS